jgi:MazG family protein
MKKFDATTEITRLTDIIKTLRSKQGCPWDRQQTAASLKSHILEEAHELLEAIDDKDPHHICDELGDLLLQTVFVAQIFTEQQIFDFADVAHTINEKMIRRHPHVFADADSAEHAQRWEEIKRNERKQRGVGISLEETISRQLPALKRASKAIKKTQTLQTLEQSQQLQRKASSIATAVATKNIEQNQLAELLFQAVKLCVALDYDAEDLLRQKTTEHIRKFDRASKDAAATKIKVGEIQ